MTSTELLEKIEKDQISGASELLKLAFKAVEEFLNEIYPLSREERYIKFRAFTLNLIKARSSVAPLIRLANDLNFLWDRIKNLERLKEALKHLEKDVENQERRTAENAASYLSRFHTVLIHSWSNLVIKTILQSRITKVYCTESYPGFEGRKVARFLHKNGIETVLVPDTAVPEFAGDIKAVIFGADAFDFSGFYNKVGTHLIALGMKQLNSEIFVVSNTYKGLSPILSALYRPERITLEKLKSLEAIEYKAPLFDFTPWNLVSALISERGVYVPSKISSIFKYMRVHPVLKAFSKTERW